MEDEIHRAINEDALGYVLPPHGEARRIDVSNVVRGTGDEVVHRDNFVAFRQTTVAQVRPEEAGTARDNNPHN